ncbi:MAG: hypothetical protein ABMA15_13100 [Vicinamibacterales bacterium]
MHTRTRRLAAVSGALALSVSLNVAAAAAQDGDRDEKWSASHSRPCTNASAAGTFGYRMNGVIVGVGPFLVNGLFTHHPDGTMDADVELVVGNASFPLRSTGGTFRTNRDCTGSGKFPAPSLLPVDVEYNFILTDDGNQIELLNTNQGVVLQGISRRISKAGRAPRCEADMVVGAYGYRLEGSLPGVPNVAVAGLIRQSLHHPDDNTGTITGSDTMSLMGQMVPRRLAGTFTLGRNCRGTGTYLDSLGNHVSFVFTAVNDGDTLFLQGSALPGVDSGAIFGVAQRVQ